MSQTFFSKLDQLEKHNRLGQLELAKGKVTVWTKGKNNKDTLNVVKFDKEREELVLDAKTELFPNKSEILCTFDSRGMTFFTKGIFKMSSGGFCVLELKSDLFKSERRSSYRLMTYPIYEVWADFDLGEAYEGGKVIDLKSKVNQTKLFQNFLQLVDGENGDVGRLRIRVQDLSATGMSIHIGELEKSYFVKDTTFKNVNITFTDESIIIPEVKVVYIVDYISSDKNLKKFKIGLNFPNLSVKVDDLLGKKINKLLREIDSNKDFENFLK